MNEVDLLAALDQHDALVTRCVSGGMPFSQFEAEYDYFSERWALDGHESPAEELHLLESHAKRISVHRRIWSEVLARVTSHRLAQLPESQTSGFFDPDEALTRLRAIAVDAGLFGRNS